MKIMDDDRVNLRIKKVPDKQFSSLQIFNVKIKNVKTATDLIESFYEKNGAKLWDDLSFVNWNVNVLKDVKKKFG